MGEGQQCGFGQHIRLLSFGVGQHVGFIGVGLGQQITLVIFGLGQHLGCVRTGGHFVQMDRVGQHQR